MKKITDRVSWVGKVDWELLHFHGDEYSTHLGSSYNSYLIQDEKTALIDTVWLPYDKEFVSRLKDVIDLQKIDYIIMNHNEVDHSGALVELMREIPNVPIYCTKKGEQIIRGHYHQDWNFVNVKTGDTLSLGQTTLTFIEAPMCHWPDTMFTYMDTDQILFSNDGFGQHFATNSLYDDCCDIDEVMHEAEKYYANILYLYNNMVQRALKRTLDLQLPLKLICPSHGVVWRSHIADIIQKYQQWSTGETVDQVTIVYDTMWQSTRLMAEAIGRGIQQASPSTTVKTMSVTKYDKNDVLTEVCRSKAILVGSPTVNLGITFAMAGILEMIHGLKIKGRKAAAFGSYGWSGDAPKILNERLEHAGYEVVADPLKMLWVPDKEHLEACEQYGREFAEKL